MVPPHVAAVLGPTPTPSPWLLDTTPRRAYPVCGTGPGDGTESVCGIAGIIGSSSSDGLVEALHRMAQVQAHRGPDGEGFVLLSRDPQGSRAFARNDAPPEVPALVGGFAHRRLAILDLTAAAAQPMSNQDGSLWLVYNGEVYNYRELRAELEAKGHRFRSTGDTEVVLRAYEEWGEACFARFNGMWGLAVWDARAGTLLLSRDRFGIKPLHYHFDGRRLVFASEIKAVLEAPGVPREADEMAVADYLTLGLTECWERTFFSGILSLRPGHCLRFRPGQASPAMTQWWDLADHLEAPPPGEGEAVERFRSLLLDAVRLRLRSDVPVGTCLSGGLDSTSIVALARPHLRKENQKTFSACFPGHSCDEEALINLMVAKCDVENYKVFPTGEELQEEADRLIWHLEVPFRWTAPYGEYKVFQLARRCGVHVTLDGQGSDEMTAGYPMFFPGHLADLLFSGRLGTWWREMGAYARNHRRSIPHAMLQSCVGLLSFRGMLRLEARLRWARGVSWVTPRLRRLAFGLKPRRSALFRERLNARLHDSFTHYTLPAFLQWEDATSMAHSVEARLPFMDWRLVAFLFSLPPAMKIRDGTTKWILRRAMADALPGPIVDSHVKNGFGTPGVAWFRGGAREYFDSAIRDALREPQGWFVPRRLERAWQRHRDGRRAYTMVLWRVVNLVRWRELLLRNRGV